MLLATPLLAQTVLPTQHPVPDTFERLLKIRNREPVQVAAQGGSDVFEPAYKILSDFITVTNDETQVISTITPQP
jgi:hypothetical protein